MCCQWQHLTFTIAVASKLDDWQRLATLQSRAQLEFLALYAQKIGNKAYYFCVLLLKNTLETRMNARVLEKYNVFTLQGSQVRNLHRPPKSSMISST
jgi:hypothetical protein